MFDSQFLERALVGLPVILFSLTVHEYFHAWMALRFGDTTARDQGRLTLHPLAHLDLMGTLVMILSGFRFGWAKPVPVNPYNLREPRKADFWISAAGPLSNLSMAVIAAVLFHLTFQITPSPNQYLVNVLYFGVLINLALAFFNLIPVFPLDGSHILRSILPESYGETLDRIDRISPIVLLILVFSGGIWFVIGPFVEFFLKILVG